MGDVKPMNQESKAIEINSISDLAKIPKPVAEKEYIESLGGYVWIGRPNAKRRGELQSKLYADNRKDSIATMDLDICAMCLFTDADTPMFSDFAAAYKALGALDGDIIKEIANAAEDKIKIMQRDVDKEKKA